MWGIRAEDTGSECPAVIVRKPLTLEGTGRGRKSFVERFPSIPKLQKVE